VELPTYTGIWRIEKRLYKLYDFRLPMPLPVGQIAVFVAITVPYVLLLTLFGLPFSHTLFWLYVLPPAVLTWLATRPVLESKRLPELIISQVRYLGEPSAWCRMTPHVEKDEMVVVGRVWRRSQAQPATEPAAEPLVAHAVEPAAVPAVASAAVPAAEPVAVRGGAWPGGRAGRRPTPAPASSEAPAQVRVPAVAEPSRRVPTAVPGAGRPRGVRASQRPVPASSAVSARGVNRARASAPAPARARAVAGGPAPAGAAAPPRAPAPVNVRAPARAPAPARPPASASAPPPAAPAGPPAAASHLLAAPPPVRDVPAPRSAPPGSTPPRGSTRAPGRPQLTAVAAQRGPAGPPAVRPQMVERTLSGPPGQRGPTKRDHVVLVPGSRAPGRPDHDKRDRARAVLPLGGPRLVAVVGCTVGAGQSVTTLMVADFLASLRREAVAALDLNPGPASLAELAAPRPALKVGSLLAKPAQPGRPPRGGHQPRGRGQLDVFTPEVRGDGAVHMGDPEYHQMFDAVAAGYGLTFADPGTTSVARVLTAADQLVLVTPASPDAARALAMTQKWLAAHGFDALTANSITVVNGLSKRSMPHAEQAELVVRGRCRAIVRVPWDEHLAEPPAGRGTGDGPAPGAPASQLGQLRPPVLQAYTALAGVLIAALAASPQRRGAAR